MLGLFITRDETIFDCWIRTRRNDINHRLQIPKGDGDVRQNVVFDAEASKLVQRYGSMIMEKLPLEEYFQYPFVQKVKSYSPAAFQLRYIGKPRNDLIESEIDDSSKEGADEGHVSFANCSDDQDLFTGSESDM